MPAELLPAAETAAATVRPGNCRPDAGPTINAIREPNAIYGDSMRASADGEHRDGFAKAAGKFNRFVGQLGWTNSGL